jgi:diguanylate cyclase (GGDEF)-like protein/PAS domain S-box-containing protein
MREIAPHLLVAGIWAAIYASGALSFLDAKISEARFAALSHTVADDLLIIGIDAKSIRQLDTWPWPRAYHARLVDLLNQAGARRIAFDVDFSSRSSLPGDEDLAAAFARANEPVLLPYFHRRRAGEKPELETIYPLPVFRPNAEIVNVNALPDRDGIVRWVPSGSVIDGQSYRSMSAALADEQVSSERIFIDFGIRPDKIPMLSYADVLFVDFASERIAGKTVLIGAVAVELGDRLSVPVWSALPGVVVHAMAYHSLQAGGFRAAGHLAPILAALALAGLAGPSYRRLGWQPGLGLAVAAVVAVLAVSLAAHATRHTLLDVSPLVGVFVSSYLIEVIRRLDRQAMQLLFQSLEVRRKDMMMRHIIEGSTEGIVTFREDGTITSMNPAAATLLAVDSRQIEGRSIAELLPELDVSSPAGLRAALAVELGPHERRAMRKDGIAVPVEISVSEMQWEGEAHLSAFIRDVTEREQQRRALEHQALHDSLTNLPNRTLFFDRVGRETTAATESGRGFAVVLLDLDHFKEINDTLGHHAGDLLLTQIGPRLQSMLRAGDTVARLGGDEFALLLPALAAPGDAPALAERIVDALTQPFDLAGMTLEISASLGIAYFPEHGMEAVELLQKADIAMYNAKKANSSVAIYDEGDDIYTIRRLALSGELRRAIEQDELVLYYQPKVNLQTSAVSGAEALVRWQHPRFGFVPPDDFIGLAEQTGLVQPLTWWTLRAALTSLADWLRTGHDMRVAVNFSARLIADDGLVAEIERHLADAGVPAERLTLEITESAMMSRPEQVRIVLKRLRDLGIRIAIDDFGTGYSSLAYLKDLPAHELKIDKSFVLAMLDGSGGDKIVRSTIDLAHNLGLEVVAEGVENEAAARALANLGCETAQGYLYSRPLSRAAFTDWLADSSWGVATQRLHAA